MITGRRLGQSAHKRQYSKNIDNRDQGTSALAETRLLLIPVVYGADGVDEAQVWKTRMPLS